MVAPKKFSTVGRLRNFQFCSVKLCPVEFCSVKILFHEMGHLHGKLVYIHSVRLIVVFNH